MMLSGIFPEAVVKAVSKRTNLLRQGMKVERPAPHVVPIFTPKCPQVKELPRYDLDKFPEWYWESFPRNPLSPGIHSWISPSRLKRRAVLSNYPDMEYVDTVAHQLTHGVSLGFRGAGIHTLVINLSMNVKYSGRLPAEAKNLRSFNEAGYRSMDAVAAWVSQGLVCGPLERHELPAEIRVSPAGEADKPNGRAR